MIRAQTSAANAAARGRDIVRTPRTTTPGSRNTPERARATESLLGPPTPGTAQPQDDSRTLALRSERIRDVLVLALSEPRLEDEGVLNRLRESFDSLFRRPDPPKRVVLDVSSLVSLSGRAIGLILTQHLRLDRLGGSIRLARPSASIATALEIVGLPRVIETYPNLDEAIGARWPEF